MPNFIYQVIRETHPDYLSQMGNLKMLANNLGVESNVSFTDRYVSVEELVTFIEVTDFSVTPYIDPEQITSGAPAYAIGADKVCVSTTYIYAKEMLAGDRRVLVPFGGSREIASVITRLSKSPLTDKRLWLYLRLIFPKELSEHPGGLEQLYHLFG